MLPHVVCTQDVGDCYAWFGSSEAGGWFLTASASSSSHADLMASCTSAPTARE